MPFNSHQILAHRGYFLHPAEKNTKASFIRAFNHGFGIETDLRMLDNKLLISHDPLTTSHQFTSLEWLLSKATDYSVAPLIALNIKSDGLCYQLDLLRKTYSSVINHAFVFDMSIPDSLSYLNSDFNVYARISEYENTNDIHAKIIGVWVDSFLGHCNQPVVAQEAIELGLSIAIVSSELHGRPYLHLWTQLKNLRLHLSPKFSLCTDHPVEALNFFNSH